MNRKTLLIFLCLFAFTINVSADFVTQIDTNFDDATLQGWDINSGTWSAANLDMNGAFLDGGSISNDVNMPIGGQYQIHFTAITSNTSLLGKIVFYTDQNGFTDANGYEFVLRDVNTLFRKITNGVSSNLIVGPPVTLNTIHTVDINISGTNYTIYVDGSLFGSTNDSTFTAGTKIFFGTENGSGAWAFDNIVVRANIVGSFGTITVLRPIDERTLEQIDGNWSSQLTNGPGSALLIADDASKNFVGIQSTTIANNIIVDDANGNGINDLYFPSTYSVILDQNEDTLILQPYLV